MVYIHKSRRGVKERCKQDPKMPSYAGEDARAILHAGIEHQFERLHLYLQNGVLWCDIIPKTPGTGKVHVQFGVIHDVFFFSMPEVTVHVDAKEAYVASGYLVIESWRNDKADRVVIKQSKYQRLRR